MKMDKRIVRTNRAIKDAFLKLLSKKEYQNITVQDIANEAFINRNTFYLHFIDKEDLLEKYTTECLNDLMACTEELNIDRFDDDYIYTTIKKVFYAIEKNEDFYRVMMRDSHSTYFTERLTSMLENQILSNFTNPGDDIIFYVKYVSYGFIGIVRSHLINGMFSSERMPDLLFKYIQSTPYSIILDNEGSSVSTSKK